jgi:hypothetical protein
MSTARRYVPSVLLMALAVANLGGCASTPQQPTPTPVAEKHLRNFGRIALVRRTDSRGWDYALPNLHKRREFLNCAVRDISSIAGGLGATAALGYAVAKGGAALPDGSGFGESIADVFVTGAGIGTTASAVLLPVTAGVGTLHDTVFNEIPWRLRAATPAVVQTFSGQDFEQQLNQNLLRGIRKATLFRVELASVAAPETDLQSPTIENRYRAVLEEGFDTVLEVTALGRFDERAGWHNPFRLYADVWITVINLKEMKEIYSDHFTHRSEAHQFVTWARDDAKVLREEIQACYGEATDYVLEGAFHIPRTRRTAGEPASRPGEL